METFWSTWLSILDGLAEPIPDSQKEQILFEKIEGSKALAAQLAQLDALPTERSAALPAAGPRRTPPPFQNVLAVERHWLLHPQTILSVRRFLVSVGS